MSHHKAAVFIFRYIFQRGWIFQIYSRWIGMADDTDVMSQQTRDIHPRLDQCRASVHDAGPASIQPWACRSFTFYTGDIRVAMVGVT